MQPFLRILSPYRRSRATANKYFGGSIAECMSYLRKKGAELQIAALADDEGMSCVEVPIFLDPDADPFFRSGPGHGRSAWPAVPRSPDGDKPFFAPHLARL